MTEWWLIGITVGIGVAAGIAFAGALAGLRFGVRQLAARRDRRRRRRRPPRQRLDRRRRRRRRRHRRLGLCSHRRPWRRPPGSDDRRHGLPPARRRDRRRPARPDSRRRVHRGGRAARARRPPGAPEPGEVRRAPLAREVSSTAKPLILVVIDGLTPSMLEGAIGSGETPTLAALAAQGAYRARHLRLPVADARLPLVDRDRRARRHPRDPASRLVRPRASSGSSSTAARSERFAPQGSARPCATRSST